MQASDHSLWYVLGSHAPSTLITNPVYVCHKYTPKGYLNCHVRNEGGSLFIASTNILMALKVNNISRSQNIFFFCL